MTYTTGLRPIHELGILLPLLLAGGTGDGGCGGYNFFYPDKDRIGLPGLNDSDTTFCLIAFQHSPLLLRLFFVPFFVVCVFLFLHHSPLLIFFLLLLWPYCMSESERERGRAMRSMFGTSVCADGGEGGLGERVGERRVCYITRDPFFKIHATAGWSEVLVGLGERSFHFGRSCWAALCLGVDVGMLGGSGMGGVAGGGIYENLSVLEVISLCVVCCEWCMLTCVSSSYTGRCVFSCSV